MTPIADFRPILRTLLQDTGENGIYKYSDPQLDAAITTVVRMGLAPAGIAISTTDPTQLDPSPPTPDAFGYLSLKAAIIMMTGSIPVNYRTRAISVTHNPAHRIEALRQWELMLDRLESDGDINGDGGNGIFSIVEDYITHVQINLAC